MLKSPFTDWSLSSYTFVTAMVKFAPVEFSSCGSSCKRWQLHSQNQADGVILKVVTWWICKESRVWLDWSLDQTKDVGWVTEEAERVAKMVVVGGQVGRQTVQLWRTLLQKELANYSKKIGVGILWKPKIAMIINMWVDNYITDALNKFTNYSIAKKSRKKNSLLIFSHFCKGGLRAEA